MSAAPPRTTTASGIVRLLNTAGGRVLVLAGAVDGPVVEEFLRRYGREPARIDGIDAGSVTAFSGAALELLRDHLDAAALAGRRVRVLGSPQVELLRAAAAG
ncbi:hypothetical protein [Blastococcus tunisiensis]|uniref:hypothetical protein n=1 Tax=Blastococcus tunisiensis TaxID=1798228 RepID=UPI000B81807E|nr:hypothetical protein [Blastococcus sp. DSM 46838]